MKELSLNILDIAQNSLSAGAENVLIKLSETPDGILSLEITDDGCGMSKEMVESVTDPFCTSRKTRKVGLGIPLLKLAAEQTGGNFNIESKPQDLFPNEHGTSVIANFDTTSIDFTPLGDICSTIIVLIQGNPDVDFDYSHNTPKGEVHLSTKEMREILGEDISLSDYEVLAWTTEYLKEAYSEIEK